MFVNGIQLATFYPPLVCLRMILLPGNQGVYVVALIVANKQLLNRSRYHHLNSSDTIIFLVLCSPIAMFRVFVRRIEYSSRANLLTGDMLTLFLLPCP